MILLDTCVLIWSLFESDLLSTAARQALPLIHKDPFDRIFMAQSIRKGADIVTDDDKIRQYLMVKTIW